MTLAWHLFHVILGVAGVIVFAATFVEWMAKIVPDNDKVER